MNTFLSDIFKIKMLKEMFVGRFLYYIIAIFLIIFFNQITNKVIKLTKKSIKRLVNDDSVESFLISISRFIIKAMFVLIILNLFGVQYSGVVAVIGALSLILGFAFKDTFSNIFSGIIILVFKPYSVGDTIEITQSGISGSIQKIEIYYTTLLSLQKDIIIIPNSMLSSSAVKNLTKNVEKRLDVMVGVAYESDIDKVKEIVRNIIHNCPHEYFDTTNDITIGLNEFASSSLDIAIRVFVQKGKFLDAKFYLLETINKEFKANGISIPFNILDVNINKMSE